MAGSASNSGIDIIGDLHGSHAALMRMLQTLGYRRSGGRWSHAEDRRLIFVGDYIDRGDRSDRVVEVVRELRDDRMALLLAGNHDTNAIAYCMRRSTGMPEPEVVWREWRVPEAADWKDWLRPHSAKNRSQHQFTLAAFASAEAYAEMVRFFMTLPLWIELPGLRVVHAAWINSAMGLLDSRAVAAGIGSMGIRAACIDEAIEMQRARLTPSDCFWRELLCLGHEVRAHEHPADDSLAIALERIVKGVEVALPGTMTFRDGDGHERREIRARWFDAAQGRPYYAYALMKPADIESLRVWVKDTVVEIPRCCGSVAEASRYFSYSEADAYPKDAPPVFFGHYALFNAENQLGCQVLRSNVGCVDNGIAYPELVGARLTAYRWQGERDIDATSFVSVMPEMP